jgi:hypothetical protein
VRLARTVTIEEPFSPLVMMRLTLCRIA